MSDYHPVIQALEARFARQREGVRQMLREGGRIDLLEEFDRKMREIDTGIEGARNCWHSISDAQRQVLRDMAESGGHLWQDPNNPTRFYLHIHGWAVIRIGRATVRALASRDLLAWEGGALMPEAKATLTERGLFVVKHGPQP